MILQVDFEGSIYKDLPYKFEAGTPPIASAIGLGKAIDYISSFDKTEVNEEKLTELKKKTREKGVVWLSIMSETQGKQGHVPTDRLRRQLEKRPN